MTAHVLVLCTGNAARSVMAGVMLEAKGLPVRSSRPGPTWSRTSPPAAARVVP